MKRSILLLLVFFMVASFAFAAGAQEASGPATVDFWLYGGAAENIALNKAWVDKFNEENSDIEVVLTEQDWNTVFEHYQTAAMAGTLPDLARIHSPFINAFGAQGGFIEPLNNFADFPEVKSLFVEGFMEACAIDGQYWGFPDTPILFPVVANPEVFAKAGVPKPDDSNWTWNDFREISKQLTQDFDGDGTPDQYGYAIMGGDLGGTAYRMAPLVFNGGGEAFNADMTESLMATEAWVDLLQLLTDMNLVDGSIDPGILTDGFGDVMNKWAAGTVAMDIEWPGFPATVRTIKPGAEVWTLQLPKADTIKGAGSVGTLSDMSIVVMSAASKNKDAAWEFLKFKTGPAFDANFTDAANGGLPVIKATYDLPDWKNFEGGDAYAAMAPTSRPWPYHSSLVEITRDVLATDALRAITGMISVEEAIASIDSKVSEILSR